MSRLPVLDEPNSSPPGGPPLAAPGETRRALDALWQRTTARPLWLPPNLLRYIRLSRRVRLQPLRRRDVTVFGPPRATPTCRACTDVCCVGVKNTVSLRLVDIATLIDLGRSDLIKRDKPSFDPADLQRSKMRAALAGSRTHSVFPVLAQDADARCAALSRDNKCTLYPHWPLSCARFPYSLDLDAREIFYSPRCQSYEVDEGGAHPRIKAMVDATLASYNERIRDFVLIDYALPELERIGLKRFLSL